MFASRLLALTCWVLLTACSPAPKPHAANVSTVSANDLTIESVRLEASAKGATLVLKHTIVLKNRTKSGLDIQVSPVSRANNGDVAISRDEAVLAKLPAGASTPVALTYTRPLPAGPFKSMVLDPVIAINGSVFLARAKTEDLTLTLPPKAKNVIYVSRDPDGGLNPLGRTHAWSRQRMLPAPVYVKWNEQDVIIEMVKKVGRAAGGLVTVDLYIRNRHPSKPAADVVLEDAFTPRTSAPSKADLKDFSLVAVQQSDPRLVWTKAMPPLAPGQSTKISYAVDNAKALTHVGATVARVGGYIVAISNQVRLRSILGAAATPTWAMGAVPVGWDMDFTDEDHSIDEIGVEVHDVSFTSTTASIQTTVRYADKNHDDNYRWSVSHGVFGVLGGAVISGEEGYNSDAGNADSAERTLVSEKLKGRKHALVFPRGWRFNFDDDDHDMNQIKLVVEPKAFDPVAGSLTWNAGVTFKDKNGDDDYKWRYQWSVLAFDDGAAEYVRRTGTSGGGNSTDHGTVTKDALKGFDDAIVIPIEWGLNFSSDDHQMNEFGVRVRNVSYQGATGTVTWDAYLSYADKNKDDNYSWAYQVVIATVKNGRYRIVDSGPFTDGGGSETKSKELDIATVFAPITWTDGAKNGTEEGIDCGGASPSKCKTCLGSVQAGSATDADLYSLSDYSVQVTAEAALEEFALANGSTLDAYYAGATAADRHVEAIGAYIDEHMEWVKDGGDWDGAQKARRTINHSHTRCSLDFCGDCEDHSIMRAALLRSLGYRHDCIYSADHHESTDQGQDDCPPRPGDDDKKSGGHTYNVVYYQGKYRLFDYGGIITESVTDCWRHQVTDNVWNDHYGEHWDREDRRPGNGFLMNYPGTSTCPTGNWNWRNYYSDVCL